ncbi:alpha-D-glucose phosphate-specific phosphoglucomutase [Suttonella sp. R2A3]|uniref:alpha-D-glucose phosphate-specific phosphoglucomutase n=1 Tax=Suttonella sp. R2A3 TaxID=2908648 RepID=UPI001F24D9FE|nr:alpha-D-glucose phosphate-specific phosphoglucomutase [Suttonella sp. R2A3]UJF24531.1 alpha-D-glucose phosphate-specific phosphoglucomutase [Suttonella sp. R2A3]
MRTQYITSTPFSDQRPGTSGLRKATQTFQKAHYSENFIQAVFNTLGIAGKTLVIGGDGRFHNKAVLQTIIAMAVAQGAKALIITQNGLLSTPAASHLIRLNQADYGMILSASHNPGGADGDFGIKVNLERGEPAPEHVTEAIYQQSLALDGYITTDNGAIDLSELGDTRLGDTKIRIISATTDYVALMQECFDFPAIKRWLEQYRIAFDALHAVTGPYAKALFVDALGVDETYLLNTTPLPDFGGKHPDPAPDRIDELKHKMTEDERIVLVAASDGDGDRNLISGRDGVINPCDSLAVIADHHADIPCLRTLRGVARSMPTCRAIDKVASAQRLTCYETPTGWKFFANLLDAELIQLCGEESFGTGGDHIREKDGLWTILCWLNILAVSGKTPDQLIHEHWQRYGRHHFNRFDYSGLDPESATKMLASLERDLTKYIGQTHHGLTITSAGQFNYTDPTNGETTPGQGLQVQFGSQARIICRLSGTDTRGVTLRIYCEYWQQDITTKPALAGTTATLASLAQGALNISAFCGKTQPDHIV